MDPKPKCVYVAGPMRGLPEFNFPAFHAAAAKLRKRGWTVFNPAERDLETGFDPTGMLGSNEELAKAEFCIRAALGADTEWICRFADAIYLLPGWENSTGAIAERALGEALGLEIICGDSERPFKTKVRDFVQKMLDSVAA